MITITQTYTRNEDKYGLTTVVFVISDTHLGLFEGNNAYINTSALSGSYTSGYTIDGNAVTGITKENGCQVTLTGHGFITGDIISIKGTVDAEWDAVLIGSFSITYVDDNTFIISNCNIGVDLFTVGDVSEKISDKIGGLISSSLDFEINEFNILDTIDSSVVDFVLDSLDPAVLRYCGLFFDPVATTRAIGESRFLGVVQPSIDDDALVWKSSEWASTTGGIWQRKITAEPIATDFFDSIMIKDLILGSEDETVPGISEAWETENVADRQGWFERYYNGDYLRTKIYKLFNFNKFLRVIADNLQTALINKNMGDYSIVFDRSELDGKYIPARFCHYRKKSEGQWRYPRFPSLGGAYITGGWTISKPYNKYSDDAIKLAIDPDANNPVFTGVGLNDLSADGEFTWTGTKIFLIVIDSEGTPDTFKWSVNGGSSWEATGVSITGAAQTLTDGIEITFDATSGHTSDDYWEITPATKYESIWLNYNTIKSQTDKEPDPEKAKDFVLSESDDISFVEYIAGVAQMLGGFAKFYYSDANTLHISFIGRANMTGAQVYFRDAEKSSRKLTGEIKSSESFNGYCNYLVDEGKIELRTWDGLTSPLIKYYTKQRTDGAFTLDSLDFKYSTENKLWFTLSPEMAVLRDWDTDAPFLVSAGVRDDHLWCSSPLFPHGFYAYSDDNGITNEFLNLPGIHTGIFMFVDKRTDLDAEFFSGADGQEPSNYWAPAASLIIQMDGIDKEFEKLSEYLNIINGREIGFFKSEITIDIPLWNGFSSNSDGSTPGWVNLAIGKIIDLDGLFYSITEIKFKGDKPSTSLALHASGRFSDIGEAISPTIAQITEAEPGIIGGLPEASGAIYSMNIVKQNADGTVSAAEHLTSENGKIVGISLHDFDDEAPCHYVTGGIIENAEWETELGLTINPGDILTLKSVVTGVVNIELNGQFTPGEFWCRIGYFIDNTKFKIDIKQLIVE